MDKKLLDALEAPMPVANIPPNPTTADIDKALDEMNRQAHAAFFQAVPCIDRDRIVRQNRWPTHASSPGYATVADWKTRQRIFSVDNNGQERFPAFQFKPDGEPHPNVGPILAILLKHRTEWQVALWFTAPNSWLDGDIPANRLDDTKEVIAAARHEVAPSEG
ncbi:MAG: hypothetical protein ABSC06_32880 [Rhodopila sp.]|jgi:hypothetical protein